MLAGREAEVPLVTCHCDVKYEILLPHHVAMFLMPPTFDSQTQNP